MILLASETGAFFGRFHPLVVHLPIGFITLAAIMHWLSSRAKFANLKSALPTILILSALTAVVSSFLGWLISGNGSYPPNLIGLHKWSGFALAPLSLLAWWMYRKSNASGLPDRKLSWLIYGLLAVLIFNGHQGGSLTHGKNYLFEKAPAPIAALFGISKKTDVKVQLSKDLDSVFVFKQIIHPFLLERCEDCHNENSAEGDLILTSLEGIKKGGSEGLAFLGGSLNESEAYQRVILNQNNVRHMPTGGKTPLTFNEIRILEWWIIEGASYDKPMSQLEAPADIKELLEKEYGIPAKALDFVDQLKIEALPTAVIEEAKKGGFKINSLSPNHPLLDVGFSASDDFDLNKLLPLKSHITWLDLSQKDLSTQSLTNLGEFKNLTRLKMSACSLSNQQLQALVSLEHLESLNLYENKLDDEAIAVFEEMKSLKKLYIWKNEFTDSAVEGLRTKRPDLEINNGFQFSGKSSL